MPLDENQSFTNITHSTPVAYKNNNEHICKCHWYSIKGNWEFDAKDMKENETLA